MSGDVTKDLMATLVHLRGPPCVLLVEDDDNDAELATHELEKMGCNVVVAPDGAHAMSALLAISPDIVFLDLNLPGMDGPEIWRAIRAKLPTVPIVIVTWPVNLPMLSRIPSGGYIAVAEKPLDGPKVKQIFDIHKIGKAAAPEVSS